MGRRGAHLVRGVQRSSKVASSEPVHGTGREGHDPRVSRDERRKWDATGRGRRGGATRHSSQRLMGVGAQPLWTREGTPALLPEERQRRTQPLGLGRARNSGRWKTRAFNREGSRKGRLAATEVGRSGRGNLPGQQGAGGPRSDQTLGQARRAALMYSLSDGRPEVERD